MFSTVALKRVRHLSAAAVVLALGLAIVPAATFADELPQVADELPQVTGIDFQPVKIHLGRLQEALEYLGNPLPQAAVRQLDAASQEESEAKALQIVQRALDPHCLIDVQINPESRVKVSTGPAEAQLVEQGWRVFLVKVRNEAGVTAPLKVASDQAGSVPNVDEGTGRDRWMDVSMFDDRPVSRRLSGVGLEYRIIQLYSRDAGQRAAVLRFDVGQGTQDLGFRSDVPVTFQCQPARPVTFRVLDEKGQPTMASFVIRDPLRRTYPAQSKRLAPDFWFHAQVYRADGEQVKLPPGEYTIQCGRGPEYLIETRKVRVGENPVELAFNLRRWVDPSDDGWWSGDHHIHAAGCAHYTKPTEGVHAPDMYRHCLGEDLKIGANLTWGPCFDYQKQFFTGKDSEVSQYPYLLRYDVEVSGFGSHQSGHLCLLRLKEQIHPGGDSKHHWPTLCLNTLKWAKKQDAVVGPAHSGWGLAVESDALPNYEVPPFDGIGANEYIVDVTHEVEGYDGTPVPAVDFISTVDTPFAWELNIWYHTLNCGFRTRISGETDFPCIYGERVGLGRAYVKIDGKLTYDGWCQGVREGRAYVSDGRSHLIDFKVNDVALGEEGSELTLNGPKTVRATAKVAAYLPEQPDDSIRRKHYSEKPYWHVERARIGDSRDVKLELVVNGYPVAEKTITADGTAQEVEFETQLDRSSWVAMRILPTSHTNPVFVLVGDKPIRASKRSAEWCRKGVDQCWKEKKRFIREDEMAQAVAAYDHARKTYDRILSESEAE